MIDIKIIRDNPELYRKNLEKRRADFPLDRLIEADRKWRENLQQLEKLRAEKNEVSREVAERIKQKEKPSDLINQMQKLSKDIETVEKATGLYAAETRELQMRAPNLLHESVPYGASDADNIEIKKWGSPKAFTFEPKAHGELAEKLGIADFERAGKIAGSGFVFLKGDLVKLDYALMNFGLDYLADEGYTLVEPPFMMKRKAYEGVTDLGDFETVMYKADKEDLYMIATSEHPMAAMYMDEILGEEDMPIKLAGISTCFRKEIGAHGIDTKGFYRMHQFNKVEQFIFCKPEDSWKFHEELLHNAEEIFRKLEIPYRVVNVCTGDIGTVAAKKYDLEAWFPRQKKYGEVVSCSNCTDYQARRLNIRIGKRGAEEKRIAHTLNSTAIATSRTIVAILENYQNKDGTVDVPKVLHPYMRGLKKIIPKKR